MTPSFDELRKFVLSQYAGGEWSIHGPSHWRRVERNGLLLGEAQGGDIEVIRLFALLHDSRRINEEHDRGHGRRAAEFAQALRGVWFVLSDHQFDQLHHACVWHTDALHHDDVTIGCCWDADRLDLGRVGAIPQARFMSTELAKAIANKGSVEDHLSSQA